MQQPILQRGDAVPHVDVHALDGSLFRYSTIWQRRNLVLIALPCFPEHESYAAELLARRCEFDCRQTTCVITRDSIPGLAAPAALVADRWGEIVHVAADLPAAEELLEWIDYVESRCPECEGEAR